MNGVNQMNLQAAYRVVLDSYDRDFRAKWDKALIDSLLSTARQPNGECITTPKRPKPKAEKPKPLSR